MTPLVFTLCVGLGALTVALAMRTLCVSRWGLLATYAVIIAAGALTLPFVAIASFGPDALAVVARSAMRVLYPASAVILGGALWLAIHRMPPSRAAVELRPYDLIAEALALHVAAWFITFDIGKIAHDAEMRQFFAASHLPLWSMYLVLAVEILASIGLCFTKSRIAATYALALVMVGAIGTHLRNGDSIGDSIDAVRMLLLLLCVYAFIRRDRRQ